MACACISRVQLQGGATGHFAVLGFVSTDQGSVSHSYKDAIEKSFQHAKAKATEVGNKVIADGQQKARERFEHAHERYVENKHEVKEAKKKVADAVASSFEHAQKVAADVGKKVVAAANATNATNLTNATKKVEDAIKNATKKVEDAIKSGFQHAKANAKEVAKKVVAGGPSPATRPGIKDAEREVEDVKSRFDNGTAKAVVAAGRVAAKSRDAMDAEIVADVFLKDAERKKEDVEKELRRKINAPSRE